MASLLLGGGFIVYDQARKANQKRKTKKADARMEALHAEHRTEGSVKGSDRSNGNKDIDTGYHSSDETLHENDDGTRTSEETLKREEEKPVGAIEQEKKRRWMINRHKESEKVVH
ncbi:MAG: hypothetical protein M1814_004591 [Vezdaea aestivalis]|nr:MAG: hypothetical protein M1814_004591 [Vezdaea aestivalis]